MTSDLFSGKFDQYADIKNALSEPPRYTVDVLAREYTASPGDAPQNVDELFNLWARFRSQRLRTLLAIPAVERVEPIWKAYVSENNQWDAHSVDRIVDQARAWVEGVIKREEIIKPLTLQAVENVDVEWGVTEHHVIRAANYLREGCGPRGNGMKDNLQCWAIINSMIALHRFNTGASDLTNRSLTDEKWEACLKDWWDYTRAKLPIADITTAKFK